MNAAPPAAEFPFLAPTPEKGVLGRLGPYRVRRLVGRGGMGLVFEAVEDLLDRRVALKVIRPELALDEDHRRRFLREAKLGAGLASDYAVPVYHAASEGDTLYLAMPFLTGMSLEARLRGPRRLAAGQAVEIARHVALGLADAHAQGVIHRDVKPANIWLEADATGEAFKRARLLDFGLARTLDPAAGQSNSGHLGTPHYVAPEQARRKPTTGQADLFSLGCVLFTMLAGRRPFEGASALAVLLAIDTQPPPRLEPLAPGLPRDLYALVGELLAKHPADRPPDAGTVAARLATVAAAIEAGTAEATTTTAELPALPPDPPTPATASGFDVPAVAAPPPAAPGRRGMLASAALAAAALVAGFVLRGCVDPDEPAAARRPLPRTATISHNGTGGPWPRAVDPERTPADEQPLPQHQPAGPPAGVEGGN